jgi:hypothetical protein
MNYIEKIKDIKSLAIKYGYEDITTPSKMEVLTFERYEKKRGFLTRLFSKNVLDRQRINIYYTRMTVAVALRKPTSKKTQKYYFEVTMEALEDIMNNPRVNKHMSF